VPAEPNRIHPETLALKEVKVCPPKLNSNPLPKDVRGLTPFVLFGPKSWVKPPTGVNADVVAENG
jgi:hypothetical protein